MKIGQRACVHDKSSKIGARATIFGGSDKSLTHVHLLCSYCPRLQSLSYCIDLYVYSVNAVTLTSVGILCIYVSKLVIFYT